jgi:hypothetical protein
MRAVAPRLEHAAGLYHKHACKQQEKGDSPPVDFFHTKYVFASYLNAKVCIITFLYGSLT